MPHLIPVLQKPNLGGIPSIPLAARHDLLLTTSGKDVWDELLGQCDEAWVCTYTLNAWTANNPRVKRIITGDKDLVLPRSCRAEVRYLALNHIKMAVLFNKPDDETRIWVGSHNAVGSHLIDLMYRVRDRDVAYLCRYYGLLWNEAK